MAKKPAPTQSRDTAESDTIASFSKPLPYYKWFLKDFRASRKVQALNYVERGLFRELLDECWEEGYIVDDIQRLAEVCGCPVGVMSKSWPKLRRMFAPLDGLDGTLLMNSRLDKERTAQDRKRATLAAAGKQGGIRKAALANASKSQNGSSKSHIAVAGVVESVKDSTTEAEHGGGTPPTVALEGARTSSAAPSSIKDAVKALVETGEKPRRLTIADAREVAAA